MLGEGEPLRNQVADKAVAPNEHCGDEADDESGDRRERNPKDDDGAGAAAFHGRNVMHFHHPISDWE